MGRSELSSSAVTPNFASPRSDGGRSIVLAGRHCGTCPVEWWSKRQATTATSSGDAQAIKWSSAVKAGKRIAEMLEFSPTRCPEIIRRTDNDSLRLAVDCGSSTKLGHQRKTAEVNFNFLNMTQISLGRGDTSENYEDIFTKTRTSARLQCFLSPWYILGVNRNTTTRKLCSHVEFHKHCESCESRPHVDTGDFCLSVCLNLAVSALLSHMDLVEARAEWIYGNPPVTFNAAQCWSMCKRAGASGKAKNGSFR